MIQIIINGGRGAGKSVVAEIIRDALEARHYLVTRRPHEMRFAHVEALAIQITSVAELNKKHPVFVQIEEVDIQEPPRGSGAR